MSDLDTHAPEGDGSSSPRQPSIKPEMKRKKRPTRTAGIVYISRVPPGMTPQKVRHLMERWGEVGKVYAQRGDGK